ncbi:hypothetical protein NXS99_04670 [Corynebacterium sp. HS2168-gen11]|nr:hypothetical protein [Corynebacterium sp. HS2168-gen11]
MKYALDLLLLAATTLSSASNGQYSTPDVSDVAGEFGVDEKFEPEALVTTANQVASKSKGKGFWSKLSEFVLDALKDVAAGMIGEKLTEMLFDASSSDDDALEVEQHSQDSACALREIHTQSSQVACDIAQQVASSIDEIVQVMAHIDEREYPDDFRMCVAQGERVITSALSQLQNICTQREKLIMKCLLVLLELLEALQSKELATLPAACSPDGHTGTSQESLALGASRGGGSHSGVGNNGVGNSGGGGTGQGALAMAPTQAAGTSMKVTGSSQYMPAQAADQLPAATHAQGSFPAPGKPPVRAGGGGSGGSAGRTGSTSSTPKFAPSGKGLTPSGGRHAAGSCVGAGNSDAEKQLPPERISRPNLPGVPKWKESGISDPTKAHISHEPNASENCSKPDHAGSNKTSGQASSSAQTENCATESEVAKKENAGEQPNPEHGCEETHKADTDKAKDERKCDTSDDKLDDAAGGHTGSSGASKCDFSWKTVLEIVKHVHQSVASIQAIVEGVGVIVKHLEHGWNQLVQIAQQHIHAIVPGQIPLPPAVVPAASHELPPAPHDLSSTSSACSTQPTQAPVAHHSPPLHNGGTHSPAAGHAPAPVAAPAMGVRKTSAPAPAPAPMQLHHAPPLIQQRSHVTQCVPAAQTAPGQASGASHAMSNSSSVLPLKLRKAGQWR